VNVADDWIEIPGMLGEQQAIAVIAALREAGIEWRRSTATTGVGRAAGIVRHVIHVPVASGRAAARAVCDALGLEDPERAQPFTGECPSCGQQVTEAWECPSCELGFRCPFDAKDPTIMFVREHGGFDEAG
jgi:hypothetical protein